MVAPASPQPVEYEISPEAVPPEFCSKPLVSATADAIFSSLAQRFRIRATACGRSLIWATLVVQVGI
jgi:hypothetical protein